MINRKKLYRAWIEQSLPYLVKFQDVKTGCFFYPYSQKKVNYCNARWQEAVLACAWYYNQTHKREYKLIAEEGIDFWCKIQQKKGFFSQYNKHDVSFAATAFSLSAVLLSLEYLPVKPHWVSSIRKAARWLAKNDEPSMINQQAVAAVALLLYANRFDKSFTKHAESKLLKVLANQKNGYYLENAGYDYSYSTLTLEMLGLYYLNSTNPNLKNRILNSVKQFLAIQKYIHCRDTDWAILDGFEIFFKQFDNISSVLPKVVSSMDIHHIKTHRHICTDLYRLCLAHDHASHLLNKDFGMADKPLTPPVAAPLENSLKHKLMNIFRIFGIHNLKKLTF